MSTMKRRRPVDLVLVDAAETLLRRRSRRPRWLPAGYPMGLILTQKRAQLLNFLADDHALREFLRRRWRSQLSTDEADALTADSFQSALAASPDPERLLAAALLHGDHGVAEVACQVAKDGVPMTTAQAAGIEQAPDVADSPSDAPQLDQVTENEDAASAGAETQLEDEGAGPGGVEIIVDADGELGVERRARLVAEEKADQLALDLDEARASLRRLEAENLRLRAELPSRADRQRVNKQRGDLQRAARQVDSLTEVAEALREERDGLLERLRTAEDALDEAVEARKSAEHGRRSLEGRLETAGGRAEYFRRSLDAEIETLASACQHATSKDRTRARKRHDDLVALRQLLDRAFPAATGAVQATAIEPPLVVRDDRAIRVVPLGGAEEIGGSALLVCLGERRILVDAGMRPDGGGPRDIGALHAERRLDAVIVTHAHNDHAGYIPALLQRFPAAQVIASAATSQLLPTMWEDSARVMQRTYEEASDSSEAPLPLYGTAEVEEAERRITDVPYHRARRIGDVEFTLFPAGHILGAAGVVLSAGGRRVVVTGDITAPSEQHLAVQAAQLPARLVQGADLLVIESTYCHANHTNRQHEVASLVDAVKRVVERRGRVLIPAFGLGRAQEVAMILARELPEVEVLVDGLAKTISQLYEHISEEAAGSLRIFAGQVRPVENRSREMKSFQSGVVVSTSGMLNGGPAVQWAQSILPEENDALLLCGYQDEYAPGHKLEQLAAVRGPKELELPDLEEGSVLVPVRAQVARYRLSAHADRRGLLELIGEVAPAKVMLVHGERRHQQPFRQNLAQAGYRPVPTQAWTV